LITIVNDYEGNWVGVYKWGTLIGQGHNIDWSLILDELGIKVDLLEGDATETGRFPEKIGEVKFK